MYNKLITLYTMVQALFEFITIFSWSRSRKTCRTFNNLGKVGCFRFSFLKHLNTNDIFSKSTQTRSYTPTKTQRNKTKNLQKKRRVKQTMGKALGFTSSKFENVASRDYGLMRVSKGEGASTPYPRRSKPIDNASIRDRLLEQQDIISSFNEKLGTRSISDLFERNHPLKSSRSASFDSIERTNNIKKQLTGKRNVRVKSNIIVPSTRSSLLTQQLLSIGTPHPKKKIVLNPKTLINRLSVHAFPETSRTGSTFVSKMIGVLDTLGSQTETIDSEEFLMSHNINYKYSKSTLKSKSSTVFVSSKPILKKSSKIMEGHHAPKRAKKVKLIVPKTNWNEIMLQQKDKGSFAERRRLHDEAEFTICKNGVPLNDLVMAIPDESKFVCDVDSYDHDKAILKLTKIMRLEGIICTSGIRVSV